MDLNEILNRKRGALSQPIDVAPKPEEEEFRIACILLKDIYISKDIRGIHPPKYYLSNADLEYAAKLAFDRFGFNIIEQFHRDTQRKGLFGKRNTWNSTCIIDDINFFLDEINMSFLETNKPQKEKLALTIPSFTAIY